MKTCDFDPLRDAIFHDGVGYLWGGHMRDAYPMVADTDLYDEEAYLLRMRGHGAGMTYEQQKANCDRFAACWNALLGIADPAAFVAEALRRGTPKDQSDA